MQMSLCVFENWLCSVWEKGVLLIKISPFSYYSGHGENNFPIWSILFKFLMGSRGQGGQLVIGKCTTILLTPPQQPISRHHRWPFAFKCCCFTRQRQVSFQLLHDISKRFRGSYLLLLHLDCSCFHRKYFAHNWGRNSCYFEQSSPDYFDSKTPPPVGRRVWFWR